MIALLRRLPFQPPAHWLLPLTLCLLAGCAYNPVTGNKEVAFMTEAEELESGRREDPKVRTEYGVYEGNPALAAYVRRIGQRVAKISHRPDLKYSFTILNSPTSNAFALPGGYVYITRGLLAHLNSEDELAAVLGHEIGHITARHAVQKYSAGLVADISLAIGTLVVPDVSMGSAARAVSAGYGRKLELEADRLGAEYLARAGYNPQAMVSFMHTLNNLSAPHGKRESSAASAYHGLFDTHPDHERRLTEIVAEASRLKPTGTPPAREDFLAYLDGLPFGESGQDGVLRGNQYFVPIHGYALKFPPHWPVGQQNDLTYAQSPDKQAWVQSSAMAVPPVDAVQALPLLLESDGKYSVEAASINGLKAATMKGIKDGRPYKATLAYLDSRAHIMVASASNQEQLDRHGDALDMSLSSIRQLGSEERQQVAQPRLHAHVARAGDTYLSLAQSAGLGRRGESLLRRLNGAGPTSEPSVGQTVKIIE